MFGFETHEQSVFCSTNCLGEMCDEWFNKLYIGLIETGNGLEIRVYKVNRKFVFDRNSKRGFYCSQNSDFPK